jgi:hypothetical protein
VTVDLVEFLEARISEDEETASLAEATEWFTTHGIQARMVKQYGELAAVFMCRFDPARVLAECEAKRQIIDLHSRGGEYGYTDYDGAIQHVPACNMCGTAGEYDEPWPCGTLRALAAVYSSHPDYPKERTR